MYNVHDRFKIIKYTAVRELYNRNTTELLYSVYNVHDRFKMIKYTAVRELYNRKTTFYMRCYKAKQLY